MNLITLSRSTVSTQHWRYSFSCWGIQMTFCQCTSWTAQHIYRPWWQLEAKSETTQQTQQQTHTHTHKTGWHFTFRARRLRLISAVSARVCLSLLRTSIPRSFPARSTRENLPCSCRRRRRTICRTAWEREELALANVWPDVLRAHTQKTFYIYWPAAHNWHPKQFP